MKHNEKEKETKEKVEYETVKQEMEKAVEEVLVEIRIIDKGIGSSCEQR